MTNLILKIAALILLAPWTGHSQGIDIGDSGFKDRQGTVIPSSPVNLPFRMIRGYPEYLVDPGDVLEIATYDAGNRAMEAVRVLPDGTVSFSILTGVDVGHRPLSEVTSILTAALGEYIRNPQIQVMIQDYLSKSVSVFGAINLSATTITGTRTGPGIYPLKARITALDQILEAGGPTPDARLEQVRLIRNNRTYTLDLQRAVSGGDNSQNVIMEHGDVLQVTSITQADRRIAVLGEVQIPGVFNLSTEANMLEAIAASRGFTQDASANRVRLVRRVDPHNPEIIIVNAERIFQGDLTQNVGLLDGDILVVPRDRLTDLNDLLDQLSPILSWGGLIRTEPILSVGGFDMNGPGGGAISVSEAGTGALPTPTSTTESTLVKQVQSNLGSAPGPKSVKTNK